MNHGAVRLTYLDLAATDQTDTLGIPGESAELTPQVAFALGRKFGTAVERNRARRRLRDAFTQSWGQHKETVEPALQLHGAFLLSGHRGLLTAPFDRLVSDLTNCFAKLISAPSGTSSPREAEAR